MSPTQLTPDHHIIAPYITSWSAEPELTRDLVERGGNGIAFNDECLADRDDHGVLWTQLAYRPGQGRPRFGDVHPLRQRRAMRRLLCQVCASPADETDDGVLWLLKDHRDHWPDWPEKMAVTEPPVCAVCVPVATRLCPALRTGAVAVRVRRYPIFGVRGVLHHREGRKLIASHLDNARYDSPIVHWMLATNLLRELRDCTIVSLEDVCPS
jgi:hypothetical protein